MRYSRPVRLLSTQRFTSSSDVAPAHWTSVDLRLVALQVQVSGLRSGACDPCTVKRGRLSFIPSRVI